jgi:2-methylaconitate cis-trans-isomerase PrpF
MKVINQKPIRCVIMRGGTSKGIFFHEHDLPADAAPRDAAILALMGSPDPRQVNGLGGADPLTSKIAIIGSAKRHDVDVTYTFGQVGIDQSYVSYSANCGNLSAAVGVYAIEEGMIEAVDPVTTVRIYNTNTRQILIAHVPVIRGAPAVEGNYAISGVPGSGAEIRLDFSQTSGATTGSMLPSDGLLSRRRPCLGRWCMKSRGTLVMTSCGLAIPLAFFRCASREMSAAISSKRHTRARHAASWKAWRTCPRARSPDDSFCSTARYRT